MTILNLEVKIPEDYVLITKVEYQDLKKNELKGKYIKLSDVAEHINRSEKWVKENVLYPPRFKKELKHFVHYPQSQGEHWYFNASPMYEWLDKNFTEIMKGA